MTTEYLPTRPHEILVRLAEGWNLPAVVEAIEWNAGWQVVLLWRDG